PYRDTRRYPPFPTRRSSDLRASRRAQRDTSDVASAPLGPHACGTHPRRSQRLDRGLAPEVVEQADMPVHVRAHGVDEAGLATVLDRKSTRLNSSHQIISYAV